MRISVVCTAILSITSMVAVGPVLAAKLEPGTYRLAWVLPQASDSEAAKATGSSPNVQLWSVDRAKWPKVMRDYIGEGEPASGLVSKNAMFGRSRSWFVAIDESKGTGTGYDTGYLLRVKAPTPTSTVDVRECIRIKLHPAPKDSNPGPGGSPMLQMADDQPKVPVELSIGPEGKTITKPGRIDGFAVYVEGQGRMMGVLSLSGGWVGTVATNEGKLKVRTNDGDEDGVYNTVLTHPNLASWGFLGDRISFGDDRTDGDSNLNLGKVNLYSGHLYVIQVSAIGDSVTIKPYAGKKGKLKIVAKDGFGKPADFDAVDCYQEDAEFLNASSMGDFSLPVGEYHLQGILCPSGREESDLVTTMIAGIDRVTVVAGKTVTLDVGGPMKIVLDDGAKSITAKKGDHKQIKLVIKAGEATVEACEAAEVAVNIRDANGKVVWKGLPTLGVVLGDSDGTSVVRLPDSLPLGTYKLTATIEPSNLNPRVTAGITVNVTK